MKSGRFARRIEQEAGTPRRPLNHRTHGSIYGGSCLLTDSISEFVLSRQVTSLTTTAKLIALTRNAPNLAHQWKARPLRPGPAGSFTRADTVPGAQAHALNLLRQRLEHEQRR